MLYLLEGLGNPSVTRFLDTPVRADAKATMTQVDDVVDRDIVGAYVRALYEYVAGHTSVWDGRTAADVVRSRCRADKVVIVFLRVDAGDAMADDDDMVTRQHTSLLCLLYDLVMESLFLDFFTVLLPNGDVDDVERVSRFTTSNAAFSHTIMQMLLPDVRARIMSALFTRPT